jgi:hypothetical protein
MLPRSLLKRKPQAGVHEAQVEASLLGRLDSVVVEGLHEKQSVGSDNYVKRPNRPDWTLRRLRARRVMELMLMTK